MKNLIQPRRSTSNEHRHIELLAYAYWEDRGRPEGSPEIDWFRAIETLGVELASELSLSALAFGPSD